MLPSDTGYTVATLPAASQNTGRTVIVSDASLSEATSTGAVVTGGGTIRARVKSDGTSWRITGSLGRAAGTALTPAQQWAAAVVAAGGTVSGGRLAVVNTFINALMTANAYALFESIWLFAAENSQSALIDVISRRVATVVNAPTFTIDRGYTGDGATSYINTGFTPSTPSRYALNSAANGCWIVNARAVGANVAAFGSISAAGQSDLFPFFGDTNTWSTLNSATGDSVTGPTDTKGFWHTDRPNATGHNVWFNGVNKGNTGRASAGLSTLPFFVCGRNNVGSPASLTTDQIAAFFVGGSLNGKEVAVYNVFNAYMTSVGAAP